MSARTEYVTWIDGVDTYRGADLERAIRAWDANTCSLAKSVAGGISVGVWHGELMVRDGWIMHVHNDGTVFLNPSLASA